jgi:hypothetical protein
MGELDDLREAWMEELPVLARICSSIPDDKIGAFVRTTKFGDLYLDGEHYTLIWSTVSPQRCSQCGQKLPLPPRSEKP